MAKNTLVVKPQQTQCNEKLKIKNVRPHNTDLKFQKNSNVAVQSKKTIEEMFVWFQDALNNIQHPCAALGERG